MIENVEQKEMIEEAGRDLAPCFKVIAESGDEYNRAVILAAQGHVVTITARSCGRTWMIREETNGAMCITKSCPSPIFVERFAKLIERAQTPEYFTEVAEAEHTLRLLDASEKTGVDIAYCDLRMVN